MKEFLRRGVMSVGILAMAASAAHAQTAQNGAYYATPSWDQQLPAATRFVVLANWNSEAVLDRETGLVWQRQPGSGLFINWFDALTACQFTPIGNRLGWRLPSVEEILSLMDPTTSLLPQGHPFQGSFANTSPFPTATTVANATTFAWRVQFGSGLEGAAVSLPKTGLAVTLLCVRGGSGVANPTN